VPLLTDLAKVRSLLDRDREWAAYAIGDLAPGYVEHCEWRWCGDHSDALMLIYRGFKPPIVFALGDASELRALFSEIDVPEISLHLRPEVVDSVKDIYAPAFTRRMRRMTLRMPDLKGGPVSNASPIGEEHHAAVAALYEDGHRRGEGPTFFSASMLRQNTFHGVWENDDLIAVAGTHLYSADLGVCAIGNVYTRSDRRGRGLGGIVTSAVIAKAVADRISTIVLNVGEKNIAAQRVYERLGFTFHGDFIEGEATRQR
jgi:GNAT superfamily N-acetyltransferase